MNGGSTTDTCRSREGSGVASFGCRTVESRLSFRGNDVAAKSTVARPWQRKFLGYSLTWHQKPKLRIAVPSLAEADGESKRVLLRGARGRSIATTIQRPQPGAARVGGLLQVGRDQAGAGRARWMDTAQVTLHPVAPIEAVRCAGTLNLMKRGLTRGSELGARPPTGTAPGGTRARHTCTRPFRSPGSTIWGRCRCSIRCSASRALS